MMYKYTLTSAPVSPLITVDFDGFDHHRHRHHHPEWLSGNRNSQVMGSQQTSKGSVYHKILLQSPEADVELVNQQAQDGTAYYAMGNVRALFTIVATCIEGTLPVADAGPLVANR